jgi:Thoeris protein ThsA, Macro domain
VYWLKVLLSDKKFWISSIGIWGVIWSVAEGGLFSLQLANVAPNQTLGYFILILLAVALIIGAITNWPLRTREQKIESNGVVIKLKFGNIWDETGQKIVSATRCFNSTVDDVVIHSNTLHGMFIKRNFTNNHEAKIRIDAELGRTDGIQQDNYEQGKTIKIQGAKDNVFLVGLTTLDANNKASVTPEEFFIGLSTMWATIKEKNDGQAIICPLIGTGRGRLNLNSTAVFCELLDSALIALKNGYLTPELVFIVHPYEIQNKKVNIEELEHTFFTRCSYENLKRIRLNATAKEVSA